MAGRPKSPRRTTAGTKSTAAKSAASKKPVVKASTAKKATAKKPAAKTLAAKKASTAKKPAAKKPATKASTAKKKPAVKKAPAKKLAVKKAPAKKLAVKKAPAKKKPAKKGATAARSAAKKSSPPDPWFSRDQLRGVVPVVLVVGLALAVLGGLAVLPARTWLSQRQNMADAQAELEQIEVDVAELEDDLELLGTEDEVERLARKNFDLVYPGEESYRIVPPEDG
jgi:cell division protein FtsB